MTTHISSPADPSPQPQEPNRAFASPHDVVQASGLPTELAACVLSVTGKLKLWNSERISVAKELCSHFASGLEEGETPSQLLAAFGDPAQSARMISKAKKKLRPAWYKAGVASAKVLAGAAGTALLVYGVLWVRFATAKPSVKIDYIAKHNAKLATVADADRAWPAYREQLAKLPKPTDTLNNAGFPHIAPDSPAWAEAAQYVRVNRDVLLALREISQRPNLGLTLSIDFDATPRPGETAPARAVADAQTFPRVLEEGLLNVKLPHLQTLREFARVLTFDTKLACKEGDLQRAGENIDTILRLASHACEDESFVINQLVGAAILALAANSAHEVTLTAAPSEAWLLARAKAFEAVAPRFASVSLQGEIDGAADLLQRAFTDDGSGDGRLAMPTDVWAVLAGESGTRDSSLLSTLASPIHSAQSPGRRTLHSDYQAAYDELKKLDSLTLAQAHQRIASGSGAKLQTEFVTKQTESLVRAIRSVRLAHARSQATSYALKVLASKQFASNQSLTPPRDPWADGALRTRGEGSSFIVYSVGEDQDDDQGKAPDGRAKSGAFQPGAANVPLMDGDTILFGPGM